MGTAIEPITGEYIWVNGKIYPKGYEPKSLLQGWQCPVCGKVYSPYVDVCQNEMCGVQGTTFNPQDIKNKEYVTNT